MNLGSETPTNVMNILGICAPYINLWMIYKGQCEKKKNVGVLKGTGKSPDQHGIFSYLFW